MTPADWSLVGMLVALGALFMLPAVALWRNHREQQREAERAARQEVADQAARERLRKFNAMHAKRRARERDQRADRPLPRPTAPSPASRGADDVTHWPVQSPHAFAVPTHGGPVLPVAASFTPGQGGDFAGAGASGDWRCDDTASTAASSSSSSDSCTSSSTTGSD